MQTTDKTSFDELKEGLTKNLSFDLFEEEEIEAVFRDIDSCDIRYRQKTLALCFSVSHSGTGLVPNVLRRIKTAAKKLTPSEMEHWVTHAFDLLEALGNDSFFRFLAKTDDEALERFRSIGGLRLQSVRSLLETYLHGISGISLKIVSEEHEAYTDTDTIYLPFVVNKFEETEKNFLLYKLMAIFQYERIKHHSLIAVPEISEQLPGFEKFSVSGIDAIFQHFPERRLALDLYGILDSFRLNTHIRRELPGLSRDADKIMPALYEQRPGLVHLSDKDAYVEGLYQYFLAGSVKGRLSGKLEKGIALASELRRAKNLRDVIEALNRVYELACYLSGQYAGIRLDYIGTVNPEKVSAYLNSKKRERIRKIENIISKVVHLPDIEIEALLKKNSHAAMTESRVPKPDAEYLMVKGKIFELDRETSEIVRQNGIFSDGILMDGTSAQDGCTLIALNELAEEDAGDTQNGGVRYDEWDYRRSDYKKAWCSLFEQDINPGDEPFVELTLKRYGGYVKMLRRKFELLKKEIRILRRQKEGEDIDIDAMVEAYADLRAGISPGQNLFVKLARQERNIGALFLLDMSGSTKGWVNRAEKEALVLMCEALDALGDRYGIYGFSGITRNNCEFYRIKSFDEVYDRTVKQRISGIIPKDYTRMGPPIRHATRILREIDARTKLLITLSDGHPEDRDGYKGTYGIEDTKRALIEAKEQGIQPFCITIDKEASSYLPHMFGEVSYIVIDDVRKLPNRITEVYRKLTT